MPNPPLIETLAPSRPRSPLKLCQEIYTGYQEKIVLWNHGQAWGVLGKGWTWWSWGSFLTPMILSFWQFPERHQIKPQPEGAWGKAVKLLIILQNPLLLPEFVCERAEDKSFWKILLAELNLFSLGISSIIKIYFHCRQDLAFSRLYFPSSQTHMQCLISSKII